jgi:uncharacterized protein Usg
VVKWLEFQEGIEDVQSFSCSIEGVLDTPWARDELTVRFNPQERPQALVEVNLNALCQPLGAAWRIFHHEQDFDAIKDMLRRLWAYTQKPIIACDIMRGKIDGESVDVPIRTKVMQMKKKGGVSMQRVFEDMRQNNLTFDRVVVGTDNDHIELQLLQTATRTAVRAGDFLDAGMFVRVNGKVEVSAGVNRLLCTNGLVDRLYLWQGKDYGFSPEFFEKAREFLGWFESTAGKRLHSVRELSVVFERYPQSIVTRHWKEWSEKVDLKELTWYDVINDITRDMNMTLGATRYKVLQIGNRLKEVEKDCRCPVCSAKVEEIE